MPSPFNLPGATRTASILLITAAMLLALTVVVFAAIFVDTDDGVLDPSWQDTPFVTDPSGDSIEGTDTDVIAGWLQNDNYDFYFRTQFAGKPALSTNTMRAAAVAFDCNGDGDFEGTHDRIVAYVVSQDWVWIMHGDQSYLGTSYYTDEGELVGAPDDDNVEWTAQIDDIEINQAEDHDAKYNCTLPDEVDIQFGSADATELLNPPGHAVPLDTTDYFTWHIPSGKALPRPTTLAGSISGSDVQFTWEHTGQNEAYQAYRSDSPYFAPGDAGVSAVGAPVSSVPWQTSDTGVVGAPASRHFYTVVGQVDLGEPTIRESDPSNEIGLFEFGLTPGTS